MNYTFTNTKGEQEVVELEQWAWVAIYKDGSHLKQYDDAGVFHQFQEIKLEDLDVFVIYNTQSPGDMSKRYEIHIEEGMTPIFFYRTTVFNMKQQNEIKVRIPSFGYKENINGQSVKTLMSIYPNGALAVQNKDGREHLDGKTT